MSYDLIVKGALVVGDDKEEQADIGLENGKIVEVARNITAGAKKVYDAHGLVAFPAGIDAHVHFNQPGRENWETVRHGSRALVKGGLGTFFDMPLNSTPCTIDKESFLEKKELLSHESYTDFALWGGLTPNNMDKLEEMAECGAIGFKAFACGSGIEEFGGLDDYSMLKGMELIKKLKLPLMVHAENPTLVQGFAQETDKKSADDFFYAHQKLTEILCVKNLIAMANETKVRLIIAHVSSAETVELIEDAKTEGIDIAAETTLAYLTLTKDDAKRLGAIAKCSPPVRDGKNRKELLDKLASGKIDFVDSDHSPSDPKLKEGDFYNAWGGIASAGLTLGGLFSLAGEEKLSLGQIARLAGKNQADYFRLNGKGKIAAGYDGDFVLLDLKTQKVLQVNDLEYLHRLSPFVGRTFPQTAVTILKGQIIYTAEQGIVGEPGGQFIRPQI